MAQPVWELAFAIGVGEYIGTNQAVEAWTGYDLETGEQLTYEERELRTAEAGGWLGGTAATFAGGVRTATVKNYAGRNRACPTTSRTTQTPKTGRMPDRAGALFPEKRLRTPLVKQTRFGPKIATPVPQNGVPRNWSRTDIEGAIADYRAKYRKP